MDPRWQHPFTCIVAGPTGCGKTTFVARLLRNASAMIDPPPERVTWYYGEWQTAYENLDIPNVRLEEGDIVRQREAWASRARRSDGRNRQSRDESVHEEEPPLRHVRHLPRTESVFEKQGEPHHQFECAVHDRVQKPARLVSARKLGPTDVPRSRRVRPGGVRRCDSLALRLSSDRPQTEHARRHASTHVRTAGRCTPVGLRTEVGVNLLLTGVAYRLSVGLCLVE